MPDTLSRQSIMDSLERFAEWVSDNQPEALDTVIGDFLEIFEEFTELTAEQIDGLPEEVRDQFMDAIWEDLACTDFEETGLFMDHYLERDGGNHSPAQVAFLKAFRDSVVSVYEVVSSDGENRIVVRDLVRPDQHESAIDDLILAEYFEEGDILAGRILNVDGKLWFGWSVFELFEEDRTIISTAITAAVDHQLKELPKGERNDAKQIATVTDDVLKSAGGLVAGIWVATQIHDYADEAAPEDAETTPE